MEYGRIRRHVLYVCCFLLVTWFPSCLAQQYRWSAGQWGECLHVTCGPGGSQSRNITCIVRTGQEVMEQNCDPAIRPVKHRICVRPCTEKVILGIPDVYHDGSREPLSPGYHQQDGSRYGQSGPGRESTWDRPEKAGYNTDGLDVDSYGRNRPRFPKPAGSGDVEWVVSQFGNCRLAPGVQSCSKNKGIRYRNVTCERKVDQIKVTPALCENIEAEPADSEPCDLLCRQDCVVTEFSDWAPCDATCQLTNHTRTREVVVPPRHRGSQCPVLSEMAPCPNCSNAVSYEFSNWLPCVDIKSAYIKSIRSHPLIGYQKRDISCVQTKGRFTSLKMCADKLPNTVLTTHRTCIKPQDCLVSEWSSLRPFNSSCVGPDGVVVPGFMIRTRQVMQLPLGDGVPCPSQLVDYIRVNKDEVKVPRSCITSRWTAMTWGQCVPVPGYNNCGTGIQIRTVICMELDADKQERPVDESRCSEPKPAVSQTCAMECNWDCSVSQWSEWSACIDQQCERPSIRRKRTETAYGQKFRTREVLTLPGTLGKPCPHLSETRTCIPGPCYMWNITLDVCQPNQGSCGNGSQIKKAECVDKDGMKTRERLCHEYLRPEPTWAGCYVPCPGDCVLSEWTQWSACPNPCTVETSYGVVRRVEKRRRQRLVLTHKGTDRGSNLCFRDVDLEQSEECPVLSDCNTYKWEVSPWGECELRPENAHTGCGSGVQTRTVECQTLNSLPADDSKCMRRVRPANSQVCFTVCPSNCRLTNWSEWSDCGVKCLPVQALQIYPKRQRRRYIATYPQHGGVECPLDLRDEEVCYLPSCETYFWEPSEWSDCVLPPVSPPCGQGLRARNMTCKHTNSQETKQANNSVCMEQLGSMPPLTEICYRPCDTECLMSQWSEWTECGPNCLTSRFRFRTIIAENKTTCRDTGMYPRDEHEDCVCKNQLPLVLGAWSDCIVDVREKQEDTRFAQMSLSSSRQRRNETDIYGLTPGVYCGQGRRYMARHCQHPKEDKNGIPYCNGERYPSEVCNIPCPEDCKVTEWSNWSPCSVKCGSGVQQRGRRILTLPSNGGRDCPSMFNYDKDIQTRVCRQACSYFVWKYENWGMCIPNGSKSCGDGTHSRLVRCISVSPDGAERTVDNSECDPDDRQEGYKPCTLPCPGDCVMSEWTEWTLCHQPCNGHQNQRRVRHILRQPGHYAMVEPCSDLLEERPCQRQKTCVELSWELSEWTSCLVNGGSRECGVGHKERFASCRNGLGERVEDHKCEILYGPVTEPLVVSCEAPCDNDCLLSDWTSWTTCSSSCGLGVKQRRRNILQGWHGNGRKCPDKLDQSMPCIHRPCYRWSVTDWSHCLLPPGVCGGGIQVRNVSCVGDDDKPVDTSKCPVDLEKAIMQTTRPCHIPCPGECALSDWTEWSNCYVSCEDFKQDVTLGVQARSRAVLAYPSQGNKPCNETLWVEQDCVAEACTSFRWATGPWMPGGDTKWRKVYCERQDGLVVEGGCDDSIRPSERLLCTNPVCVPPAVCNDTNFCVCPDTLKHLYHVINATHHTCIMNTSGIIDSNTGAKAEVAKTPNIWMYAVIVVGTVFVIAVTAALYNMCELFRTGPRPRRKGENSREGSTTGTIHSVRSVHGNGKGNIGSGNGSSRSENLYKQITLQDSEDGTVMEKTLGSAPVRNSHHSLSPPFSSDPDDIPDIDAMTPTSTPVPSSVSTATTNLATTTPVTPTTPGNVPARPTFTRQKQAPTTTNHVV